ncbi:MAG TPA: hypothetical protein VGC40_06585 [Paenirhodobacter sp.]
MTEDRTDDSLLEPFFAAARAAPPLPEARFMAELARAPVRSSFLARCRGWVSAGFGVLGAWGVGGLVTAAVAGLWLGFAGVERSFEAAATADAQTEADAGGSFFADSDILVLAAQ